MTDTDTLIDQLADRGATPPANIILRFAGPLAGVALLCIIGVALTFNFVLLSEARSEFSPLVTKWGFSIALLLLATAVLWALGRPGARTRGPMLTLAIPFVLVGALLVLDLALSNSTFPGATWRRCLLAMSVMSPVAFAGAIIAVRWLAPTNLRKAGFVAGMFGGAVAMTAYAPFCPELGVAYMAVFYCLPILTMAAIGWMIGRKLLRW